jgi:hypothetical protein
MTTAATAAPANFTALISTFQRRTIGVESGRRPSFARVLYA